MPPSRLTREAPFPFPKKLETPIFIGCGDPREWQLDRYAQLQTRTMVSTSKIAAVSGNVGYLLIHPGPRTTFPGVAPVCSPFARTWTPLTNTWTIPVAYWWGATKVA